MNLFAILAEIDLHRVFLDFPINRFFMHDLTVEHRQKRVGLVDLRGIRFEQVPVCSRKNRLPYRARIYGILEPEPPGVNPCRMNTLQNILMNLYGAFVFGR